MVVVKNINNNVSLCLDSRNQEIVVFGKGVGAIKPPAEIPLSRIERTFYDLSQHHLSLLNDIPSDIIEFTARQLSELQHQLPYETNSNLVFTLADHLAFAITRMQKGTYISMPSVYELEANYPLEIQIGRQIVAAMEREFKLRLPKGEVQGVAMHFINARSSPAHEGIAKIEEQYEDILECSTQIIEQEMGIQVARDTFHFARFATHMQYLLKRIFGGQHVDSANILMYEAVCDEYEAVSRCVDRIGIYLKSNWSAELTEEERIYLILHVNRVCSKERE